VCNVRPNTLRGAEAKMVCNMSDAMNTLMAIPNLIGLLIRETRLYEEGIKQGAINKFD
jgi:Na+/alanine symporter